MQKNGSVQFGPSRFRGNGLTMSYFHTGTRTIIGAKAFHYPVRDGKEWDHLAMVIKLKRMSRRLHRQRHEFIESKSVDYINQHNQISNRSNLLLLFIKVIGSSLTSN